MKKLLACILSAILLMLPTISVLGEAEVEAPVTHTIEEKAIDLRYATMDDPEAKTIINVYFMDGQNDIPYFSVDDLADLLNELIATDEEGNFEAGAFDIETLESVGMETSYAISKKDGDAFVLIDLSENTVSWSDFDGFNTVGEHINYMDIINTSTTDANGEAFLFQRNETNHTRIGEVVTFDLDDYSIPTVYQDGKGYLPLQTVSDLFISPYGVAIAYNGEKAFLVSGSVDLVKDEFYTMEAQERSDALAYFSANEFALALDVHYGLKEKHSITSFYDYLYRTGLMVRLTDPDAKKSENAIQELMLAYFGDLHSGFVSSSPYAGRPSDDPYAAYETPELESDVATTIYDSAANNLIYAMLREDAFPDGCPAYEEVGDTAYITFNSFIMDPNHDYYADTEEDYADPDALDTIQLIHYAHQQITRENSPIKRIVMDLSLNGGGMAEAAIFTASWFVQRTSVTVENALTHAQSTITYLADINLDHEFDDEDSLPGEIELVCLTSPNCFSCGNLVPALFKAAPMAAVRLIGKKTGGGACVVQVLTLADGTVVQCSGNKRLASISNGSYSDIDDGILPDVTIVKEANFYNREALNAFMDGLF